MPDSTPVNGWPVPVLTDDPNIPSDVTALALAIEQTGLTDPRPVGDSGNSVELTSDINFTASQDKNILSTTITLDHDQWVILAARAGFTNGSSANPLIGIYIDVDSVFFDGSGAFNMGATTGADRLELSIPANSKFMTSGTHTIRLRGDRNGTSATVTARATDILNQTYAPCRLTIIV